MPSSSRLARTLSPLLLASLAFAGPVLAADYVQAPGSALTFASQFQGEVFVGRFPDFRTTLSFDPADPAAAKLDVVIPLATVTTRNPERDETLVGNDFFASDRFPQARYTASGFRPLDDGRYAADGTLTLRGVSQPVTLTFSWSPGEQPVLTGKATVQRLAFDVGTGDWADTADLPNAVAVSTKVLFKPAE
ncbi:YceI family protein [Marilutibacter alkalisoli]|uniref:Polyisoprenoid-binding protein n=1 Tax=Marilutibacter alkalisoli TaxID=2591633 RepID=A0A514BPJ5_9GAMM|nr:YceI family protein [Lysobacter alkalisoli]QDH69308.1 polyisoprenoid-binding protein [Lysobacter alkalisoli]